VLSDSTNNPETASLLLASIVSSADDAIVSKTLEGTITSWNPAAEAIFGYSADEIVGRPIYVIIPPELAGEEVEILRRIGRGERIAHFETERLRKNGSRVQVSVTISPLIKDGRVIGASKIARDITERKSMERDLADARARLAKYSQELEGTVVRRTAELNTANAELEAFAYTAAHDLRGPLRRMRTVLGILAEDELGIEKRSLVSRLTESAERMSELLEALLNLSRIGKQDLQREEVSLDDLIKRAVSELSPEAEGRQVKWQIGPLPIVSCDPPMMQQALINLVNNALKYTKLQTSALIEIGQMQIGDENVIFVRDNGIGFKMEQADKLFTPFHRLHPERQFSGTGVGLATVDRIIRRHGGRVWAESKPNEGATFYFTIPKPGAERKQAPALAAT
jgi:PAS domain S-box-containing protein